MNRKVLLVFSTLMILVFTCGAVYAADNWPAKKIDLIWHSKAGSGGDIFLRALAKFIESKADVPVVVSNVTGASGANAWNRVSKAKPDGYTILGVSSTIIASPLQNNIPVNYESFDPIARMFIDAVCLFVATESPYNTLEEFLDDARKNPGELTLTGGTAGNIEFVSARELLKVAGADVAIVPFEGGGDGVVSVLGGHVTGGIGEYAEVASSVEGGKIRILAVFNKLPGSDLPSIEECGYPVSVEKLRGIVVPKGTPKEVKDKILGLLKEAMDDPDFKAYYTNNYLVPAFAEYEEFKEIMRRQTEQVKESLN